MLSEFEYLQYLKGRDGLRPFMEFLQKEELGLLCGAEIGVQAGDNADAMLRFLDLDTLLLVDIWAPYTLGEIPLDFSSECSRVKARFQDDPRVTVWRTKSVQAAKSVRDVSLDFVYIDACHTGYAVKQDIEAWKGKVREGGYVAGHDYCDRWPEVVKAVDEAFKGKMITSNVWDWWVRV